MFRDWEQRSRNIEYVENNSPKLIIISFNTWATCLHFIFNFAKYEKSQKFLVWLSVVCTAECWMGMINVVDESGTRSLHKTFEHCYLVAKTTHLSCSRRILLFYCIFSHYTMEWTEALREKDLEYLRESLAHTKEILKINFILFRVQEKSQTRASTGGWVVDIPAGLRSSKLRKRR